MPKVTISEPGGQREMPLVKDVTTIGRIAQGSDIAVGVPEASREHCTIIREGPTWFVQDLGSRNGTRVNGRKVTKFELQDGDEIQVGVATIRFFEADVVEIAPAPEPSADLEISLEEDAWLRFLTGDRADEKIVLEGRTTFGSKANNTVVLKDRGVSGSHCEVVTAGGEWIARDLGSTNGTFVGGDKIVEEKLQPGSVLRVGIVEFVFGVGENAGAATLVQTVTLPNEAIGAEVFEISERNLGRKAKAQFALWLGAFVVIFGAAAAYVGFGVAKTQETVEVRSIVGNLVAKGQSFEFDPDLGDYLVTESDAVEYAEVETHRHSGKASLQVTARGGSGSQLVTFAADLDHLSASDRLEVGGWFRTAAMTQGTCGLAVRWRSADDRVIGTTYVNAPAGESSFIAVKGALKPPFGTARATFGIAVHEAQGKVWVDDVHVVRLPSEPRVGLVAHEHEVMLEASGSLSVSRDTEEVIRAAGMWWSDGAQARPTSTMFRATTAAADAATVEFGGDIASTVLGPGGNVALKVAKTENGIRFEGRVETGEPGLAFGLVIDPDEGLVTVAEGKATRRRDAFKATGVTSIVVSFGHRAVRMAFERPTDVTVLEIKDDFVLLLPLAKGAADEGGEVQSFLAEWQLDFEKERKEVADLDQAAGRAEVVEKAYGKAMLLYQDIIDRFPFRQDVTDRAAGRLQALEQQGWATFYSLEKRLKDTVFFGTYEADYDELMREAETAAASHAGAAIADQLQGIAGELSTARTTVLGERHAALARNHLMRGRDLMEPGHSRLTLARGFFISAMKLVPDSEVAKEAADELKKLETLLGVK